MKQRKIPQRTCLVTREKLDKKDLIRVVRTPEGDVKVDLTGKANGRGAYLKKELAVFDQAEMSKILDKTLEVEIPAAIYNELRSMVF